MNESQKCIVQDGPDIRNNPAVRVAFIMWLVPWMPLVLTLWCAPGYLTSFFSIPIVMKLMVVFAMWQILCCLLMGRTTNNIHRFVLTSLSAPPIVFMVVLGPAVGAIFRALPF